jgi:signal transduction histidine kinase
MVATSGLDKWVQCLRSAENHKVDLNVGVSAEQAQAFANQYKLESIGIFEALSRQLRVCEALSSGYPKLNADPIRAAALLQDLTRDYPFRPLEVQKVKVSIYKDFTFLGDGSVARLVMASLLSKALEAVSKTPDGHVKIYSQGYDNDGWIVVEDNGVPVPENERSQIFDILADSSGRGGVLLYFCKRMTEEMGYSIDLYASPTCTQFFLNLHVLPGSGGGRSLAGET